MIEKDRIRELSESFYEEILQVRRDLHRHPEISYQEYQTSSYIQEYFKKLEIPFSAGYVMTGMVARLEGKSPGKKTVALRADMDALPVTEKNDLPFRSQNTGIMHACGHDVHMASLLGTAKILHTLKEEFEGTILFIFQPAEEKIPGGARGMINEGAFEAQTPDIFLAQHVMPELSAGQAGFCAGPCMASTDEIYITIHGKGGHAAIPDQLIDPVLIASHTILALQQVSSRMAPAEVPTVLSIGRIEAEGANNIIPSEVKLFGTFRTRNEKWRREAHEKIRTICDGIARSMGAQCDIDIDEGYPMVTNDPELTGKAVDFAVDYLGKEQVIPIEPQMTAEDFAYYGMQAPSLLYRLGTAGPENTHAAPLHAEEFSVDETALKTGMGLMSWMALNLINET